MNGGLGWEPRNRVVFWIELKNDLVIRSISIMQRWIAIHLPGLFREEGVDGIVRKVLEMILFGRKKSNGVLLFWIPVLGLDLGFAIE